MQIPPSCFLPLHRNNTSTIHLIAVRSFDPVDVSVPIKRSPWSLTRHVSTRARPSAPLREHSHSSNLPHGVNQANTTKRPRPITSHIQPPQIPDLLALVHRNNQRATALNNTNQYSSLFSTKSRSFQRKDYFGTNKTLILYYESITAPEISRTSLNQHIALRELLFISRTNLYQPPLTPPCNQSISVLILTVYTPALSTASVMRRPSETQSAPSKYLVSLIFKIY